MRFERIGGFLAGFCIAALASAAPKRMFVTSTTCNGDLGGCSATAADSGLTAGDNVCQERANAAGLNPGGTAIFRAWLSTPTTDAYCHIQGLTGKRSAGVSCDGATLIFGGPWVRIDGQPFARSIAEFDSILDGVVALTPPRIAETGATVSGVPLTVFTGSGAQGLYSDIAAGDGTCSGWTSTADGGTGGVFFGTIGDWTQISGPACATASHLYCFEQGTGDRLPVAETAAALAFLTNTSGNADLSSWLTEPTPPEGLLAGDEICRLSAAAAGLPFPDDFLAWLSDDATDAKDRFSQSFGWKRLDGIALAANEADLLDATLVTSVALTETLVYQDSKVWTGTDSNGVAGTSTADCGDWTDGTSGTGWKGDSGKANSDWSSDSGLLSCSSTTGRLYCLGTREVLFWDGFEFGDDRRWGAVAP